MKTISTIINEAKDQKEFIIIKPGFLQHTNDIMNMLRSAQVYPIEWKIKTLTMKEAQKLYEPHKEESFYEDLCKYMCSGPSLGLYCCNSNSIDMSILKDNIRKKYGIDEMKNAIHSSDSGERRRVESNIYFRRNKQK